MNIIFTLTLIILATFIFTALQKKIIPRDETFYYDVMCGFMSVQSVYILTLSNPPSTLFNGASGKINRLLEGSCKFFSLMYDQTPFNAA